MMKWAITILPWALASQKSAFAQTVFQCSICGEGKVVTISDGIVTIPQNGDFICSDLEAYGEQGGFDAQTCVILESFVQTPCGCVETVPINGTATPTQSLTIAPTFGPEPDCYEDLDNLNQREISLSLQEIQIGRTYILCPGTVFFMGRLNQDNEFENGFSAIVPRPNVHYKCGDSGSSANNCRLLDGNYPIISLSDDEQHTNVTFQGLTIESAAQGGVLAVMPGDLTFLDCIFKVRMN